MSRFSSVLACTAKHGCLTHERNSTGLPCQVVGCNFSVPSALAPLARGDLNSVFTVRGEYTATGKIKRAELRRKTIRRKIKCRNCFCYSSGTSAEISSNISGGMASESLMIFSTAHARISASVASLSSNDPLREMPTLP